MNKKKLEELQNDFAKLIHKYKLQDTLIISNKVIVKPNEYNDEQIFGCLFAALEHTITDAIIRLAYSTIHTDFDIACDKTMTETIRVFEILKRRVKHRIEEVKDKHISYN